MKIELTDKDLRIGNYYFNPFKQQKIWDINNDFERRLPYLYLGSMHKPYAVAKPIPLNEEWLLKFGFDKFSEISGYFEGEERYCCEYILTYDHEITNNLIEKHSIIFNNHFKCDYPHIKHVHQLQNLYFAITGEELKLQQND